MTATERLRAMLDEHGVEWIGTSFSKPAKGHPTNTSLGEEHHEATFIEYDDGNVLRLFDLTPEQAVEATLGSDLQDENAKLRELLRPLVDFADCKCDLMEDCTACQMFGDGIPCDLVKALRYMHELGVKL